MNKDNAKDYLPLVQALADGKQIQVRDGHSGWCCIKEATFCSPPDDYRIKPEPKEIWVNEYSGRVVSLHESKSEAVSCRADSVSTQKLTIRHYREVIE